eukprot:3865854-Rhodomonas_salina.2
MDVELEIWVSEPVPASIGKQSACRFRERRLLYISPRSSEKVVNHDHFMSLESGHQDHLKPARRWKTESAEAGCEHDDGPAP